MIVVNEWISEPKKISINNKSKIEDLRNAAESHRQSRRRLQSILAPDISYTDICKTVENETIRLLGNDKKAGIGFPTGISANDIVAHDSANPNDNRTIRYDDVVKIDFGTHINGNIIDSAFTVAFNEIYTPLLNATKEATNNGIRLARPGIHLIDLSESIKETIESYELIIDDNVYPIRPADNFGGHNILPYKIHAGKLIFGDPKHMNPAVKIEADECFAIETFATTGEPTLVASQRLPSNHFMLKDNFKRKPLRLNTTKQLLAYIKKTYGTLPFSNRWLEKGFPRYKFGLSNLVKEDIVEKYPPVISIGSHSNIYTSQFEHTIYIHDTYTEVLSSGDDY